MGAQQAIKAAFAQIVACPRCQAQMLFRQREAPDIDASGFEVYSLDCAQCLAPLAGVIDPYDEALLLSDVGG